MMAATPPFATKESAADEAVEEAGVVAVPEVAAEAGEEGVDPPLVAGYAGMDPLAPDPPAAVDAEGAIEPLAPVAVTGRVNGILLGVALPVALRPRGLHSMDCNAHSAIRRNTRTGIHLELRTDANTAQVGERNTSIYGSSRREAFYGAGVKA